MKKNIFNILLIASLATPAAVLAQTDKLVVQDSTGTTKFVVKDTGEVGIGTSTPQAVLDVSPGTTTKDAVKISGTDSYNTFQIKVQGHAGGNAHAQIVTDVADGRFTFLGGPANDYAPRLHLVSGQESQAPQVAGWAIFDYGSHLVDLPNATFKVRHINTKASNFFTDMLACIGSTTVAVPSANFGIGTTTPGSKLSVVGLPTAPPDASGNQGVVCITNQGNMWVDSDGTPDCQ